MAITLLGGGGIGVGHDPDFATDGVPDNSLVICFMGTAGDGNYGAGTPSGWTRPDYTQTSAGCGGWYYKHMTGAADGVTDWTANGSVLALSWIAITGMDIDTFEEVGNQTENPSSLTHSLGALGSGDLWVCGIGGGKPGTTGNQTPSGWTNIDAQHQGGWGAAAQVCYKWGTDSDTENPGDMWNGTMSGLEVSATIGIFAAASGSITLVTV